MRTIALQLRGHEGGGGQRYAYQAGLGIGQLKKKRDWQFEGYWQHQEQFSLDPNLIDSDLFNSQLNHQGLVLTAGYMLADAVLFNVTWSYAWRINGSYGTGGTWRHKHQSDRPISIIPSESEF